MTELPPGLLKRIARPSDEDPKADSAAMLSQIISLVGATAAASSNARISRAVSWAGVALSTSVLAKTLYANYKKSTSTDYVLKITESDDIFAIAEQWLNASMPQEKQKAIFLHSGRKTSGSSDPYEVPVPDYGSAAKKPPVTLSVSIDGTISQNIVVDGHPVTIQTQSAERPESGDSGGKGRSMLLPRTISFTCKSLAARNAVVAELEKEAQKLAVSAPIFYSCRTWGSMERISDIPVRPAETVILKEGQMERILGFLRAFQSNEKSFVDLGIPYRTGVLLHGNPGSGKSSTAATIAHELGLNIYYISLSTLEDDDALSRAMNCVGTNSVVILEDVDTYHGATDRENDSGVTMQGLLNALDGFISPHGVITIMTTNRLEVLDPAIIRPGRVDLLEELNELDDYQLRAILRQFTGSVPGNLPKISVKDGITSADIIGQIKNHIPNVHEAGPSVVDFITKKVTCISVPSLP